VDILDDMGVSELSAIFFLKVNYSFKRLKVFCMLFSYWGFVYYAISQCENTGDYLSCILVILISNLNNLTHCVKTQAW